MNKSANSSSKMEKATKQNIRLGIFVIVGTLSLITALYFIGSKQNLFGSTIQLSASFTTINGLQEGNNVRFAGIDVGTVESIKIINDTTVKVTMIIEKEIQQFVKKNTLVSIGTDGMMGSKLLNLNPVKGNSRSVNDGDHLAVLRGLEMDATVKKLGNTTDNINIISENLKEVSEKLNNKENAIGLLFSDKQFAASLSRSMRNIEEGSQHFNENMENLQGSWLFKNRKGKDKKEEKKKG